MRRWFLLALLVIGSFFPLRADDPFHDPHACLGNASTTGADANWLVHMHAESYTDPQPGCNEVAVPTCATCPEQLPVFYRNSPVYDLDVSCWAPGTYTVQWLGSCEFIVNQTCYSYHPPIYDFYNPVPYHQTTAFTVPKRHPTAKVTYIKAQNKLRIDYDFHVRHVYGEQIRLYLNDDTESIETFYGLPVKGTVEYAVSPSCTQAKKYSVKLRSCDIDPFTSSGAAVVNKADPAQCPIPLNAPCTPKEDLSNSCPIGPSKCFDKPVNFATGDVSVTIPMFTIDQQPMPLSFDLSYHSLLPFYGAARQT